MSHPTGNDNSGDDGDKGGIGEPGLPLDGHNIREDRGEEGGGSPNSLVEGDREEAKRNVTADDGAAEDEAEGGDLPELVGGSDGLHRHQLHPRNRDVAE